MLLKPAEFIVELKTELTVRQEEGETVRLCGGTHELRFSAEDLRAMKDILMRIGEGIEEAITGEVMNNTASKT